MQLNIPRTALHLPPFNAAASSRVGTYNRPISFILFEENLEFSVVVFLYIFFLPGVTKNSATVYAVIHLPSTAQETVLHKKTGHYWGSRYIPGKLESFVCGVEIVR